MAGLLCTSPALCILSIPGGTSALTVAAQQHGWPAYGSSKWRLRNRRKHDSSFLKKVYTFSTPFSVCRAGPEESSETDKGDNDKEIKPPRKTEKKPEGPVITEWGGNVRGGKYQLGQGADRILELFANGDGLLIGAIALIMLFLVLLQFRPPPPP